MVSGLNISTTTMIAVSSFVTGACLVATIFLIAFLTLKELLRTNTAIRLKLLSRSLNIAIFPLLIGFIIIVGVKVFETLAQ